MVKSQALNKYKLLIGLALVAISTAGLFLLIKTSYEMQKQIMSERHELASLKVEAEALDKVLKETKALEPKLKVVTDSLPARYDEVAYFVEELEGLATQSAVPITIKIDKEAEEEKNQLSSVVFSVSSNGAYPSYARILSMLANLPFHTKIESIKIKGEGAEVSSVLDFKVYIWKDNPQYEKYKN